MGSSKSSARAAATSGSGVEGSSSVRVFHIVKGDETKIVGYGFAKPTVWSVLFGQQMSRHDSTSFFKLPLPKFLVLFMLSFSFASII
jgi:hypothetical protein